MAEGREKITYLNIPKPLNYCIDNPDRHNLDEINTLHLTATKSTAVTLLINKDFETGYHLHSKKPPKYTQTRLLCYNGFWLCTRELSVKIQSFPNIGQNPQAFPIHCL
jgi:hypothetical protein